MKTYIFYSPTLHTLPSISEETKTKLESGGEIHVDGFTFRIGKPSDVPSSRSHIERIMWRTDCVVVLVF